MDWYGLGIAMQFRDNATSGLTRVTQGLTQLSRTAQNMQTTTMQSLSAVEQKLRTFETLQMSGYMIQNIGNSISTVGHSMLEPLISVASQVTQTGAQFENYRLTLKALYGDAEVAVAKTNEAIDLAAKTPFQLSDVMDAVVGFKAIGVEALDTMEGLTGESRTLLEYIGDLASLRPDIGLEGMLYGIRNLLGGDGGRSLRSRLDMDFEQMLGFEWADSAEGMIEQIVYASQQIANGLMKEMEGSWKHMTSNLEDQWDKFKLSVADNGFFEPVKNTLKYFYEAVERIDEEKMTRIGKNIADAFNMIWKPIDFVAQKLTDFFAFIVDLVDTNPLIAKFVTGFISLAGALTVVSGTVIALGGAFLILIGGLNLFAMQIRLLPTTLSMLVGGLKSALLFMGKFALIGGTLYTLWKTDFAGIRTILSNFMRNVYTAFKKSSEIASMGATEMINSLEALDTTTFGGWLTYQLVRLQVLWMALVECWNTNELSDETFQKVQYLGLLPLISFILDCKARFESFIDGFIVGWQKASDFVRPILEWLGDKLSDILDYLIPAKDNVKDFNTEFGQIDLSKWERAGELVGLLSVGLLLLLPVIKIGKLVWGVISSIISFFSTVGGVVSTVWGWLGAFVGFLASVSGLAVGWVVAILVGIALVVVGIIKYKDQIIEVISKMWEVVKEVSKKVWDWILEKVISPIATFIEGVCQIVVGIFQIAWGLVSGIVQLAWNIIKAIVLTGVEIIKVLISPLVSFFEIIWIGIGNVVRVVWEAITSFIKWAYDEVTTRWNNMVNFFKSLWDVVYNNVIAPIWNLIVDLIKNAYEGVKSMWEGAKQFFSDLWNNIKTTMQPIWDGIQSIIDTIYENVTNVWNGLCEVFSGIWDNIKGTATTFFNWLGEKFTWVTDIINGISGAFNSIKDGVSNGLGNIVDGAKKLVGLNTGGYVKTEGVAMLHPNEVVVNDVLTQKLRNFLDGEEQNPDDKKPKPQPVSFSSFSGNTDSNTDRDTESITNDYSMNFNQGSIVINYSATDKGTDADAKDLAQKVMKYIQKETKLRNSLNYAK